jgi:acyl-coenzyme A synthetase/AMP-(fatty) acid ligase
VKTWGSFVASNAGNASMLGLAIGDAFHVVATVPPQHMYGMEMSVLMPLLSEVSVHAARPFFPADVATALASLPEPRVLVTTPVHLRALIESGVALPPLAAFVSATAPMPVELAMSAEARFGAPLHEVFGSTETCVFASRRTAIDDDWKLYEGVVLHPQPDGTLVDAPQLAEPIALADIVSMHDEGRRFRLCGRNTDLLEIAGKRASLGDLNRRLLAIDGVRDGVLFQLDADPAGIRRIAGLVVAPGLTVDAVLSALRHAMDPVFLPRPLRLVDALPRNETGKLPRTQLIELLGSR